MLARLDHQFGVAVISDGAPPTLEMRLCAFSRDRSGVDSVLSVGQAEMKDGCIRDDDRDRVYKQRILPPEHTLGVPFYSVDTVCAWSFVR